MIQLGIGKQKKELQETKKEGLQEEKRLTDMVGGGGNL
jgi:hypothetical protein